MFKNSRAPRSNTTYCSHFTHAIQSSSPWFVFKDAQTQKPRKGNVEFVQFRFIHARWRRPLPPNLGISKQFLQRPQSWFRQFSHLWQRLERWVRLIVVLANSATCKDRFARCFILGWCAHMKAFTLRRMIPLSNGRHPTWYAAGHLTHRTNSTLSLFSEQHILETESYRKYLI